MGKRVIVTKDKIIKYLKMYKNLNNIIKNRELRWIIEKGPSFQEWERGKNTVEAQAIKLIEDKKLNELKFYKENLNKYIFILKSTYEKEYYKYIVYRYIKNYSKEKNKKGTTYMQYI